MSGSALSPWALSSRPSELASAFLHELGCSRSGSSSSGSSSNSASNSLPVSPIDCLRSKSVQELLRAQPNSGEPVRSGFGPIVDGLIVPLHPQYLLNVSLATLSGLGSMFGHGTMGGGNLGRVGGSTAAAALLMTQPGVSKPMMFGMTRVESPPFAFTSDEQLNGLSAQRRNHMLRTLVHHLYDYYQEVNYWGIEWKICNSKNCSLIQFVCRPSL